MITCGRRRRARFHMYAQADVSCSMGSLTTSGDRLWWLLAQAKSLLSRAPPVYPTNAAFPGSSRLAYVRLSSQVLKLDAHPGSSSVSDIELHPVIQPLEYFWVFREIPKHVTHQFTSLGIHKYTILVLSHDMLKPSCI